MSEKSFKCDAINLEERSVLATFVLTFPERETALGSDDGQFEPKLNQIMTVILQVTNQFQKMSVIFQFMTVILRFMTSF